MVAVDVERNIEIPGTDLQIHGTYREVPGAPLVVFSHCLGGERNLLEYYTGARAMSEAGFSSYRFDYYAADDDARNLVDCTVKDHVADLDLVVKTFKEEEPDRHITVVGHSLGGLVILMSEAQQFDAAVLWEGTHSAAWKTTTLEDDHTVWEPSLNLFRLRWGYDILVSREYLESYRLVDCDEVARAFRKPLLVIVAAGGMLVDGGERYHEHSVGPSKLAVLEGLDHSLTKGESLRDVQQVTIDWMRAR